MISFVVAMGENNAIGKAGHLPWHLPNDLKHFKKITEGHPIIMGRKTFESLPGILPNRPHLVITRDMLFRGDNEQVTVFHSISDLLGGIDDDKEYFVIGGAEMFKQLYPFCSKMYLTRLEQVFDADTFFPTLNLSEWEKTDEVQGSLDDKNTIPYCFLTFERRK